MPYIPITNEGEALTVGATAVTWASVPASATRAQVYVMSAAVRFTVDGVTPTATTGDRAARDARIILKGAEVQGFKAIRETAVSATLHATFYSGSPDMDE